MSLPLFALHRPAELPAALELLDRYGDDAQILMGGTELLLVMKMGFAAPEHLIDCKRLDACRQLRIGGAGTWAIGSAVTHRQLETDAAVARHLPQLRRLEKQIANVRVRNAGTIGGNLCFAEPHSDPATLLIALGAHVVLVSRGGQRIVPLEDFIKGPLDTGLRPGELMVSVQIPAPPPGAAIRFERLAFRERPIVNMAFARLATGSRLVAGAVGARPERLEDAQRAIDAGEPAEVVAEAAMSAVRPLEDLEGSVDYKRHLVGVLAARIAAAVDAG